MVDRGFLPHLDNRKLLYQYAAFNPPSASRACGVAEYNYYINMRHLTNPQHQVHVASLNDQ
jgi:hypothetical protein